MTETDMAKKYLLFVLYIFSDFGLVLNLAYSAH